jgi:hypothetical protein
VISEQARCDSSAIQLVSMHFVDAIYRRCDPLPYELLMLNTLTVESDAFWWLLRRLDLHHFPSLKNHRHDARTNRAKNRAQQTDPTAENAVQKVF